MSFYSNIFTKLLHVPGIGSKTAQRIVEDNKNQIGDDEDFIKLLVSIKGNYRLSNLSEITIRDSFYKAEDAIGEALRNGVKTITIMDDDYPTRLKNFKTNPPAILNYKGDISSLNESPSCAVIGTREPTGNGYSVGVRVGELLAENNVVVVSGLAKGCDTAGHLGCLNKNGKTVAVLAHGLKHLYPKENRRLADSILEKGGALISEYFYAQTARNNFFVERDRIQAGLSDNIFVVETGVKGGTMHTVKYAIENQRKVFTYKHPDKYKHEDKAQGNQMLINESKATPIANSEDFSHFLVSIFTHVMSSFPVEKISTEEWLKLHTVRKEDFPTDFTGNIYKDFIDISHIGKNAKGKIKVNKIIKKLEDQKQAVHNYPKLEDQQPKEENNLPKEEKSLKKESEGEKKNTSNDSQTKLWE